MLKKFWLLFLIIFAVAVSVPASASVLNLPDIGEIPSLFDLGDENNPVSPSSFVYDGGTGQWSTYNCGEQILLSTDGSGTFYYESDKGDVSFTLTEIGRYDRLSKPEKGTISVDDRELQSVHDGFCEWYINGDDGIEQEWTFSMLPPEQENSLPDLISGEILYPRYQPTGRPSASLI